MSPRETCQPHIAVGWQVIEKILETEGSSVNLHFYNLDLEKLINTDILTIINYEIRKFTEEPFRFTSLMHISAISFVKHTIILKFHSIVYSVSYLFKSYNTQ